MDQLDAHVFSLRPIRSNLVSHCHTSKASPERGFKLYNITGFFRICHRVPSQPRKLKVSRQLFGLKLQHGYERRHLFSLYLASLLSPTPLLYFQFFFCFSTVCVILLHFLLPLLPHPAFTFAAGSNGGA